MIYMLYVSLGVVVGLVLGGAFGLLRAGGWKAFLD